MNVSSVKLVYFSPTGTTRKVLEGIAEGTGIGDISHVDMTLSDAVPESIDVSNDSLVVIGAPVYAGRLPEDAVKRLRVLKAENTPAVVIVLYGNREYEDALLELANLSKDLGFIPVSGAAFIGEHSYATEALPIANGRPDEKDVAQAISFGADTLKKIEGINTIDDISPLEVPGNFPYKEGMPPVSASPSTLEDLCTTCGTCAEVCPKAAITVNDIVETDPDLCIRCNACVKACPTEARIMDIPRIKQVAKWLNENYSQRKEPEVFS
jgi:ferredoxin